MKTNPSVTAQLPFDGIIKEGRTLIGPEMARRMLDETNFSGQRKIDQSQVDTYAEMMRIKVWLSGGQIAFGRLDETLHLVNGQHRLAAVAQCDIPQEFQVLVVECNDIEHLRELYWRFDAVMRPRTTQQLLGSTGLAETHKVSRSMAVAVYQAMAFVTNDMRSPVGGHKAPPKNRIIDLRLHACEDWWSQARTYEGLLEKCQTALRSKLFSGSIVAIALVTLKHQLADAIKFWKAVASNDGLRKGDPCHTLVQYLLTTHDKGSGEQNIAAVAAAWNAFFGKRRLSLLRPTKPARINGTPFDGKQHKEAA